MKFDGGVYVEAPARLHLGLIDLRGDLGRRFGGTGMALSTPSLLLEAAPAPDLTATGPERDRLLLYGRRFLDHYDLATGARLRLVRRIPAHSGLGSGTQIALATARALAELNGVGAGAGELAMAVGRARRSAIGTWMFDHGGFVLEGGRRTRGGEPGPLLLRRPVPAAWRCVLVLPRGIRGLSGSAEERAFDRLPTPPEALVGEISRLILMLLLPSLVEADLEGFGAAVTEIQRRVGDVFQSEQSSRFAHPVVSGAIECLLEAGAAGAGQSSWGPAVYGFAEGDEAAAELKRAVTAELGDRVHVRVTQFDNEGARSGWSAHAVGLPR